MPLFLSPEYLGDVSPISAAIVGMATGIFIMSWNITTFILFSRHFRFLATTTKPFLEILHQQRDPAPDLPGLLFYKSDPVQHRKGIVVGGHLSFC